MHLVGKVASKACIFDTWKKSVGEYSTAIFLPSLLHETCQDYIALF